MFLEPEAKFLSDMADRFTFDIFVSFHSGVRQIFIPFSGILLVPSSIKLLKLLCSNSDSKSKRSGRRHFNEASELSLGALIAAAAGPHFDFNVAHILNDYPADGTAFDYMAGVKQVGPFTVNF